MVGRALLRQAYWVNFDPWSETSPPDQCSVRHLEGDNGVHRSSPSLPPPLPVTRRGLDFDLWREYVAIFSLLMTFVATLSRGDVKSSVDSEGRGEEGREREEGGREGEKREGEGE